MRKGKELSAEFANMLISAGLGAALRSTTPDYRYFRIRKDRFFFCWNTEGLTPSAETKGRRWAAWIYKGRRERKGWRYDIKKTVYFASRKKAKKRAFQWYEKRVKDFAKKAEAARLAAFGGSA